MAVVEIALEATDWTRLEDIQALAHRAIAATLAKSGVKTNASGEISLLLTDDAEIAALNRQWRGKDSPTNVLSFPAVPVDRLAQSPMIGDIALAIETCSREASQEGKSLQNHVTHLLVHGTLHLLGFDHETEDDAEAMETLERRILADLGIADPYADENKGAEA